VGARLRRLAGLALLDALRLDRRPAGGADAGRRPTAAAPGAAPSADVAASDVEPGEPPPAEIPAAYAEHAEALLHSSDRKARKTAVDAITRATDADKEAIPLYLRNIAWLEKSPGCPAKKAVLRKMEEDDDPRVAPCAAAARRHAEERLPRVPLEGRLHGLSARRPQAHPRRLRVPRSRVIDLVQARRAFAIHLRRRRSSIMAGLGDGDAARHEHAPRRHRHRTRRRTPVDIKPPP
jgi:hypothetical protein